MEMHHKQRCLVIFILGFLNLYSALTAAMGTTSHHYSCLKQPFNITQFQQCQAFIKKTCSKRPIESDLECIQPLLRQTPICRQSQRLVNLVNGNMNTLQVTQHGSFFIVNNYTIADGKNNYSILTPKGCLFNTAIDVRQYDATLKKRYKKMSFLTLSHGKPRVLANKKNTISVIVPLKINNTCVACPTIGYASVGFYFTKEGDLNRINVIKFSTAKSH